MWTGPLAMAPNAITYQQEQWVQNLSTAACVALYLYEFAVTFDRQLKFLSHRRITGAFFLYASMQISTIVFLFCAAFASILTNCTGIAVGMIVMYIAEGVLRGLYGAISALRIFAVNDRKYVLPLIIALLYFPDMIEWIYQAARQTSTEIPGVGCIISYNLSFPFLSKFTIFTQACIIVSEALVVLVIWRATYGIHRLANIARTRLSVAGMLLRDGSMYFVALAVLSILDIILVQHPTFIWIGSITTTLTTILISRMFLNLHGFYSVDEDDVETYETYATSNTIGFAPIACDTFRLSAVPGPTRFPDTLPFREAVEPRGLNTTQGRQSGTEWSPTGQTAYGYAV